MINLFIVGAPKCGTSAMYEYLSQHPAIKMCDKKEPNFFDTDLHYNPQRLSIDEYEKLFHPNNETKYLGEASPWYLYSKTAAQNIFDYNPAAKIIIMLRNPYDMMYSLHSELLYQGCENELDFEKALQLEKARKQGQIKHEFSSPKESVYYRDLTHYFSQIKRYYDVFGRENVKVLIYDDLKLNSKLIIEDVLKFLGLQSISEIDTQIVNPNKTYKIDYFRKMIMLPSGFLKTVVRIIFPSQKLRIFIAQFVMKQNTKVASRTPLSESLIHSLQNEYKTEIQNIEKLIERDLSFWYNN